MGAEASEKPVYAPASNSSGREVNPDKYGGFTISKISDEVKVGLAPYNIIFQPILDQKGRQGVRITYPADKYSGTGGEKGGKQVPINGFIDLDGDTVSLLVSGPIPFGLNTEVLQFQTKDRDGKEFVVNIITPRIPVEKDNTVKQKIAILLAPNTQDWQSIMNNIDVITQNANTLNPQQVQIFRSALQYGIENNGFGLVVAGFDPNSVNGVYVKYGPNHYYTNLFRSELGKFGLQKDGPRYTELMKRLGELTNMQPFLMSITSDNWKNLNIANPEWNKPLPSR